MPTDKTKLWTAIGIGLMLLLQVWGEINKPVPPSPDDVVIVPEPAPEPPAPPVPDPLDPADAPVITAHNSRGERLPSKDLAALIAASALPADSYTVDTQAVGKPLLSIPVVVGVDVGPVPPGPNPPTPPNPIPVPLPGDGLRVLIVYESADVGELPPEQAAILTAVSLHEWAARNCVKVNGTPELRIYDKDTDITRETEVWQRAMKLPRTQVPWLYVSDGKTGHSAPLPPTLDELMGILRRYGQ